jgi:hypothetical protein
VIFVRRESLTYILRNSPTVLVGHPLCPVASAGHGAFLLYMGPFFGNMRASRAEAPSQFRFRVNLQRLLTHLKWLMLHPNRNTITAQLEAMPAERLFDRSAIMRSALRIVVPLVVAGLVIGTGIRADDAKVAPSEKQIIDVVGERMSKVFSKFGYPDDLFASDASSDKPTVFLDYGPYGFKVRKKVVQSCMFFSDWKGTILGTKMGDTAGDVAKKLGTPETSAKGNDDLQFMTWTFKEWGGTLEADFDKDNKMKRVVVSAD